jgi:Amt family ammonium transporter
MGEINAGDTGLVLMSAALVALMTPGLAFFYGGLVRRKNFLPIMMRSFISIGIVTFIWVSVGYSLAFSGDMLGGLIRNLDWAFLNGVGEAPGPWAPTIPALAHFTYQEMFAIITPALITGAFADRVNFKAYLWFLVAWSLLVYVPFTHWIWGGGFLSEWGDLDFAGGTVVHVSAGMAALTSVWVVGRRVFAKGERKVPHNIAFVGLGTGLLWFGWFGLQGLDDGELGEAAYNLT